MKTNRKRCPTCKRLVDEAFWEDHILVHKNAIPLPLEFEKPNNE